MEDADRTEKENMLACAKTIITDLDSEISKLNGLRDMWIKIIGKLQGELYGRIKP